MAIGTAAAIALGLGSLLGGAGKGISSYIAGKDAKEAASARARQEKKLAREQALGPIRGGSARAREVTGELYPSAGMSSGSSALEKLGSLSLSGDTPQTQAMGAGGMPIPTLGASAAKPGAIDLTQLFAPKKFGTGYSIK